MATSSELRSHHHTALVLVFYWVNNRYRCLFAGERGEVPRGPEGEVSPAPCSHDAWRDPVRRRPGGKQ